MTNIVKRSLRCLVLIALFLGLVPVAMMAAEGDIVTTGEMHGVTIENNTITVSGAATMTGQGTGDAVTINADTTLVFEEGATLTLTGYDNGFVVNGATLSGGGWVINDGDGMDLIRLKTGGKLNITGDVDLNGHDKTNTTSRGIVLESTAANGGQQITLAANTTLYANNFYRGLETGGAKGYTISGDEEDGKSSSIFDFQNNTVGMALSYFDENANYENCKLEVSNCVENGIFMRQDNAAIWGLNFNGVDINCVNNIDTSGIAIRFHAGPFRFDNSTMTIDGSTTTGLWIYDGWDTARTGSGMSGSTITVKNVTGNALQRNGKAITMAICHEWNIDSSTIAIDDCGYAGINLSNDTQVSRSGLRYTAVPRMVGGKLIITDSDVHSSNMMNISPSSNSASALFTVQVGQFLKFGDNMTAYNDNPERPIVMCAKGSDPYPYFVANIFYREVPYNLSGLDESLNTDLRFSMTGGSSKDLATESEAVIRNKPVNEAGTVLSMIVLSETEYNNLKNADGSLTVSVNGESDIYHVDRAADDDSRYIWVPEGATIVGGVGSV